MIEINAINNSVIKDLAPVLYTSEDRLTDFLAIVEEHYDALQIKDFTS